MYKSKYLQIELNHEIMKNEVERIHFELKNKENQISRLEENQVAIEKENDNLRSLLHEFEISCCNLRQKELDPGEIKKNVNNENVFMTVNMDHSIKLEKENKELKKEIKILQKELKIRKKENEELNQQNDSLSEQITRLNETISKKELHLKTSSLENIKIKQINEHLNFVIEKRRLSNRNMSDLTHHKGNINIQKQNEIRMREGQDLKFLKASPGNEYYSRKIPLITNFPHISSLYGSPENQRYNKIRSDSNDNFGGKQEFNENYEGMLALDNLITVHNINKEDEETHDVNKFKRKSSLKSNKDFIQDNQAFPMNQIYSEHPDDSFNKSNLTNFSLTPRYICEKMVNEKQFFSENKAEVCLSPHEIETGFELDFLRETFKKSLNSGVYSKENLSMFFIMTFQSIKLNSKDIQSFLYIDLDELYTRVKNENIPFHQYYFFIREETKKVKFRKNKKNKENNKNIWNWISNRLF